MRATPYPDLPPFHPACPHLVAPVRVDPTGARGPTRAAARSGRWRRTSHGLYVPATVNGELVEQRIVEAAAVLPSYGGVTGWAQLRWAGGHWFDGFGSDGHTPRPVALATASEDIRPQPGIVVSAEHLDEADMVVHDGLRTTIPVRSLLFELRFARTLVDALVAIDMAAYSDLVSLRELAEFVGRHVGWPGIRLARLALALADENSWSPRETLMRFISGVCRGLPPAADERSGVRPRRPARGDAGHPGRRGRGRRTVRRGRAPHPREPDPRPGPRGRIPPARARILHNGGW